MAKGKKATDIVAELAAPVCEQMGLMLWDVTFEKEGPDWYLTVYIDSEDGINIDQCEAVSRALDPLIDQADPVQQNYIFSVSSPGLGRKLSRPEHFQMMIGEKIRVRYIRAQNGVKELSGILSDYNDGNLTLTLDDSTAVAVDLKLTSSVRLCDDEDLF